MSGSFEGRDYTAPYISVKPVPYTYWCLGIAFCTCKFHMYWVVAAILYDTQKTQSDFEQQQQQQWCSLCVSLAVCTTCRDNRQAEQATRTIWPIFWRFATARWQPDFVWNPCCPPNSGCSREWGVRVRNCVRRFWNGKDVHLAGKGWRTCMMWFGFRSVPLSVKPKHCATLQTTTTTTP